MRVPRSFPGVLPRPPHRSTRSRARSAVVAGVLVLLLAGCGGPLAATGSTPTADPAPADTPGTLPTFGDGTAVGEVVAGFPADLLPVPEDAEVLASAVTPTDGPLVRVSLSLTTPRAPAEVVDQLAGPLAAAGFTRSDPGAPTGLTAQAGFARRTPVDGTEVSESLLVGVLDAGDRRLVTVSGQVVPAVAP